MVKDVSAQNLSLPFGKISISADEVLAILREMNFSKITAKNGNIEFDNIDDIEKNKQLFSGEPTIYADGIVIRLSRYVNGVSFWTYSENPDVARLHSLHKKFIHKKGIIEKILDHSNKIFFVYMTLAGLFFSSYIAGVDRYEYIKYLFLSYISPFFSFIIMLDIYISRFRNPVYYRERDGFWRRNSDKITLTVIGAVIGWLAKWLAG